ncbi:MAG: SAM-dependent methyltransferase [Oscillospiraceae bacterium]|nr:SAM-dependent methyltransferase [Oscillospiraceae bacterium]
MNEECLICRAPLEYLEKEEEMECAFCHRKENSRTRCIKGHYVCDDCHTRGIDAIAGICLNTDSKDPVEIVRMMMAEPFCHMHGPEHHVMVGSALLAAYKNAGGDIDLEEALKEMQSRGKKVPGGSCGFWGACGAGISAGMFVSIITKASPLTEGSWGLSNLMTAKALEEIGKIGGPRCCKRDSYLAILSAVDFVKERFGVEMENNGAVCTHSGMNNQCIGNRCPFIREADKAR